jgi:hypothetical protein
MVLVLKFGQDWFFAASVYVFGIACGYVWGVGLWAR